MAGVALVPLNYRLSAAELAWIIGHSGSGTLFCSGSLEPLATEAIDLAGVAVKLISDGPTGAYEQMIAEADPENLCIDDELSLLSINYTSGTTGTPKGVQYHHRGAFLQSLAMIDHASLSAGSVFLWTLPMFHCHGWCFTWAVTAAGATHVCLPKVDPPEVWRLISAEGVTHLNGAPTVITSIAYDSHAERLDSENPLKISTGGAPPTPALLERLADLGADVIHLYGMTETYGPSVVCDWHPEWDRFDPTERARLKARQGVGNVVSCTLRVVDSDGRDVAADGSALGEIAIRGDNVMVGYFKDPDATRAAAPDGWLRTGDLGVMHPDGYVEIRDRSKDCIISGGENISSVEVEQVLASHPDVLEVAVVAMADDRFGEVPAAFVTLHEGAATTGDQLISYVRDRIAHFKAPKAVFFGALPKTATGKIQKFRLRAQLDEGRARD
jgi:fatty-acyl-CoA synthase